MCSVTFLSLRFMIYAPSFISDMLLLLYDFFLFLLLLRKTSLNLGLSIICLVVSILLNGWSGTKIFYTNDLYYYIFLLLEQLFMSLQLLF